MNARYDCSKPGASYGPVIRFACRDGRRAEAASELSVTPAPPRVSSPAAATNRKRTFVYRPRQHRIIRRGCRVHGRSTSMPFSKFDLERAYRRAVVSVTPQSLPATAVPPETRSRPSSYCMVAAVVSLELHGWVNHALWSGAAEAGVMEVRFRLMPPRG